MNLSQLKLFFSLLLCLFTSCFFFSPTISQIPTEIKNNPIKKYDQLVGPKPTETAASLELEKKEEVQKDELVLLLPKLDSTLYQDWKTAGKPKIWTNGNGAPNFVSSDLDISNELGVVKILKQTYQKENHVADILIYKFASFSGAYGAYTVMHKGNTTKLKVGKNASEAGDLIDFWKGNYFVDISTSEKDDMVSKEFVVLASQDISKNILIDQLPPVVAIQLPSLNRVQGSEKYCLGSLCCKKYFLNFSDLDFDALNLSESGGIITADYKLSDSPKNEEKITLLLIRYVKKESAQAVFNSLKEKFEMKVKENKDMDIDVDIDESSVMLKNKKNDYTALKQRGNLLAIAYGITNKKSGEKILGLVPWPIEINKPINIQEGESKVQF